MPVMLCMELLNFSLRSIFGVVEVTYFVLVCFALIAFQ